MKFSEYISESKPNFDLILQDKIKILEKDQKGQIKHMWNWAKDPHSRITFQEWKYLFKYLKK